MMDLLKRWTIPVAGLIGLLAFLVTYTLAGTHEQNRSPKAARALALSGAPSCRTEVRFDGPEPSPASPERPVPLNRAAVGHGPLGYLRDVPLRSGEAGRKEAIRRTAEHLGVPEESQADFAKAASQALSDMAEASRLQREEARALGLSSPGTHKALPGEASRQLRERYAARRAGALGHFEPYLSPSPAGEEFRTSFDAWVATVWLKGQEAR